MNTMNHNGYIARIEFDEEDRIFTGRLMGVEDIVTFHGESVAELETAFHDAVKHFAAALAAALDRVDDPDTPYDPNDEAAVDAFWENAEVRMPKASLYCRTPEGSVT
jgi:hypothetical protein